MYYLRLTKHDQWSVYLKNMNYFRLTKHDQWSVHLETWTITDLLSMINDQYTCKHVHTITDLLSMINDQYT